MSGPTMLPCAHCGGHGTVTVTVTEDVPGLTPVMRKRIAQGRPAVLCTPCPACDGQDRVTPYLETIAELDQVPDNPA